ncbi:MAG: secretin N-terminal domain-containing protein [Planctomycetota bacterium]
MKKSLPLLLLLLVGCAAEPRTEPADEGVAAAVEAFEVVPLQHTAAAEIAATLERAFAERPAAAGPRPQVLVDSRTNSLLVQAAPEKLPAIRARIAALDVPRAAR